MKTSINTKVRTDKQPTTNGKCIVNKHIHFYRKERPEETLAKIEPILNELQIQWYEILGSIQPLLKKHGVEIYENETDTSEINCILITDGTPEERHCGLDVNEERINNTTDKQ